MITIKTSEEIEKLKIGGKILGETLVMARDFTLENYKSGELTTLDVDKKIGDFYGEKNVKASFKGYTPSKDRVPFSGNACISTNEEVVHGIPGKRRIKSGDLVGLDLGVILDGYCSDTAATVAVGVVKPEWEELRRIARECLEMAIDKMRVGNRLGDLSYAVESHAKSHGYSVVRALAGHGIGRSIHEEPEVPNFGPAGFGIKFEPGLVLAVEPMINMGVFDRSEEHTSELQSH